MKTQPHPARRSSLCLLVDILPDAKLAQSACSVIDSDPESALDAVLLEAARTDPRVMLIGEAPGEARFDPMRGVSDRALADLLSRAFKDDEACRDPAVPAFAQLCEAAIGLARSRDDQVSIRQALAALTEKPKRDALLDYAKTSALPRDLELAARFALSEDALAAVAGQAYRILALTTRPFCKALMEGAKDSVQLIGGDEPRVLVNRACPGDPDAKAFVGSLLRLRALSWRWRAKRAARRQEGP